MTGGRAFTRFILVGAFAMAMAAACGNGASAPGAPASGGESVDASTIDASGSPRDGGPASDAAARDAAVDTGGGSDASSDAGAAGGDGASDAAGSAPDAAGSDGGEPPDAAALGTAALEQDCTAMCAAQAKLSCSMDIADCQSNCVTQASDTENPSVSCESKYAAMAQCEAKLSAAQWICSETNVVPIPIQGKCTTTVCSWSCCVGSDYADPDIWAECMPSCP